MVLCSTPRLLEYGSHVHLQSLCVLVPRYSTRRAFNISNCQGYYWVLRGRADLITTVEMKPARTTVGFAH
jgi:hypothetical protein